MVTARMQAPPYPSFGKCIYCGAADVPLTDEHIIPLSLQGQLVIDDACCIPCQQKIGKYETQVIKTLEHFRARYKLWRYKPNKAKKAYSFSIKRPDGSRGRATIPIDEMPATAWLYKFGPANILKGKPPFDPTFEWLLVALADTKDLKHATDKYGWDGEAKARTVPEQYARLLAKIGYAYAVAELGLNAFKPLCLDIVLGRPANCGYLVGGSWTLKETAETTSDHLISIGRATSTVGPSLVVVLIRLFQQMRGAPHHHVVVGSLETDEQVAAMAKYLADNGTEGPAVDWT